jgi:hypothetical protein
MSHRNLKLECGTTAPFRQVPALSQLLRRLDSGGLIGERSSVALNCREKARERLSQFLVGDLGHGGGQLRRGRGIVWAARPVLTAPERRLPEGKSLNRPPSEEAVDALADYGAQVLDFHCRRAFNAQNQDSRMTDLWVHASRPLNFYRLTVRRDLAADNLGPAGHQFRRRESLSRKGLADDFADDVA